MKLVLDASMAMAWRFERFDPAERDCAQKLRMALGTADILVPAIWHLEIANGLLVAERRGCLTMAHVDEYLNLLDALPIKTEDVSLSSTKHQALARARISGLSVYDAAYLALAMRSGAALATFDRQLAAAMRAAGGTVYE